METKTTESSQELLQSAAKDAPKVAEDGRWKQVNRTMRLNGYAPHALIETLHAVQESFGYLDIEALKYVSEQLKLPRSLVYGAATFYHFFSLKPAGEHTCVVCMGTACYIAGVPKILDAIQQSYSVSPGETTADNKISILTARCIGSCGLSPAAVFDGEVAGKLTPDAVLDKLGRWVVS
ncbi:MAG TPA: bidirectional hydrogenase complex protein HoxE [Dissulfurispiraceae bacterium]|nr:bidirectional hydrogenase complex protein HoxE [Dissulfurispiraceae bacterium]